MAEEVLQESFVAIWNHARDYAPDKSAPMTWMATIVRNRCLDIVRRPTYEAPELDENMIENVADEANDPLEHVLADQDAQALADCLRRLDGAQRQSITLAFFHGLSHSELAAHLREPLGTIKTRIRRGLIALRNCLSRALG
jgi:RNA polymerase sigma-70 factor (ECF subfamily)